MVLFLLVSTLMLGTELNDDWSTEDGVLLRVPDTVDGGEGELKALSLVWVDGDLLTSFERKFGAMNVEINTGNTRDCLCQLEVWR
jgi:hypothetical protein